MSVTPFALSMSLRLEREPIRTLDDDSLRPLLRRRSASRRSPGASLTKSAPCCALTLVRVLVRADVRLRRGPQIGDCLADFLAHLACPVSIMPITLLTRKPHSGRGISTTRLCHLGKSIRSLRHTRGRGDHCAGPEGLSQPAGPAFHSKGCRSRIVREMLSRAVSEAQTAARGTPPLPLTWTALLSTPGGAWFEKPCATQPTSTHASQIFFLLFCPSVADIDSKVGCRRIGRNFSFRRSPTVWST
jgi:hypothetical protein